MNSVKIYVAKNQLNTNNLLIDGECLDLFESETIPFTMKQTDLSDIGTNFAAFTKDFIIPASKKNNRILKHWMEVKYDDQLRSDIPIPARIDISSIYFSLGSIKIMSFSTTESGEPKNYTITYTGALKSLKTLFGDTLLSDLPFASIFGSDELLFDDYNVVSRIENTTHYQALEIPLISSKRTIPTYESIKYTSPSTHASGIVRGELRPALKFRTIFEAMSLKYGLSFTGNFINEDILDKLYIWLNKNESLYNSGGVVLRMDGTAVTTPTVEFRPNLGSDITKGYVTLIHQSNDIRFFYFYFRTFAVSDDNIGYRAKVQEVVLNPNGTINETLTYQQPNFGILFTSDYTKKAVHEVFRYKVDYENKIIPIGQKKHYRIIVETEGEQRVALTNYQLSIVQYNKTEPWTISTSLYTPATTDVKNKATISSNIPELKLQDFLTTLIKMFNLVIIPKINNTFELDYYTNYYATGEFIDITKYCTPLKKINRVKTYKEILFKPEDGEYAANKNYKSQQYPAREYGEQSIKFLDGDVDSFKVEPKYNLMLFRALNDINYTVSSTLKNAVIVGDGVGTDNVIVTNKPTFFFNNGKSILLEDKKIAYNKDGGGSEAIVRYTQFSNVDSLADEYTTTLCFSSENMFNNEYGKNLYTNNYQSLMSSISSPYSREFEIDCVLPKHIFMTISLNNQVGIGNEVFSISEISVDLLTGKSKLKLNNIIRS